MPCFFRTLAFSYMMYLFICVFAFFVFARLTHWIIIFDTLEQSPFQKYATCWVFLAPHHMMYLCILYLYFCICAFDTWDYHFWYPWTILFSKICHTLGLSGTLPYAVFVYLYICVFVFLYLRVWRMGISFLIPLNNPLFKNMPHVGSFWHLTICCVCVFVYFVIVFVFFFVFVITIW